MDELIQQMQQVLANTTALYQKAHKYHWNVTGSNFYTYHKLFEQIYEELYDSIDGIGEQIKALDGYAPYSPQEIANLTSLRDAQPSTAMEMVRNLFDDNNAVMSSLMETYKTAEKFMAIGLSNFLQDRYDHHKKIQYFLRATMKGDSE